MRQAHLAHNLATASKSVTTMLTTARSSSWEGGNQKLLQISTQPLMTLPSSGFSKVNEPSRASLPSQVKKYEIDLNIHLHCPRAPNSTTTNHKSVTVAKRKNEIKCLLLPKKTLQTHLFQQLNYKIWLLINCNISITCAAQNVSLALLRLPVLLSRSSALFQLISRKWCYNIQIIPAMSGHLFPINVHDARFFTTQAFVSDNIHGQYKNFKCKHIFFNAPSGGIKCCCYFLLKYEWILMCEHKIALFWQTF